VGVSAELIAIAGLSEGDLARWRELAARAVEPNPYFEPEYVLPLARGLGDLGEVSLLVVAGPGGWRACLPVHVVPRWHRVPLRSLSTWRGHLLYGLLGTPLVAPEQPGEDLAALIDGLPTAASGTVFAGLEWVDTAGPLGDALAEVLSGHRPRPIRFERFERALVRRRAQPTYVEETLSSKHRRELRRQRRKLGEALEAEPQLVDRAGQDSAYDDFIALEASGRRADEQTVLAADPGHAAFFKEMCRGFAEQGRLQLFELQAGDQTVAAKCNLLAGNGLFCLKIAYDERWSSMSPGILLELDTLKVFHEATEAEFIDSCADPNNAMINRLWPDRRELATYALPAGDLRGRAARPALSAARSIRNRKNATGETHDPAT
jgi:CelD/BcsL family acetyltransferase involved in cellulose biosynthesis